MPHPGALWVMLDELENPIAVAVDREDLLSPNPMPRDAITRYVSQDVLALARRQERDKEQTWILGLMEQLGYDLATREQFKEYFDRRK